MIDPPKGCPQPMPLYIALCFKLFITGGLMFVAALVATFDDPPTRSPNWERAKRIGGVMAVVGACGLIWSC